MIEFLIKSAISMGVLLGIYHLFLEREKMHRFNRFYLLFSIAFSLVLPLIIIPIYVEAEIVPEIMYSTLPSISNDNTHIVNPINYTTIVIWLLYGLVTSLLLLRFAWNILSFKRKVGSGEIIALDSAKLVLVDENTLPYTFLNYIFVNKQDYEERTIEDELFTHELTHVKQKHTLDILFIEILKAVFWFNPLLYLYGRSIRLNHEFLADENVVEETQNVISYQNILLQKTSGFTPVFASNLNFSLTKKRLLMMTKTTSRTKALLLQTAIAPILITLLTLLCTEEVIAQQNRSKNVPIENKPGMHMESITQFQIDSLKKADPVKYKDVNREYFHVKKRIKGKDGKIIVEKSFNKISELYSKEGDVAPVPDIIDYKPTVTQKNNYGQDTVYSSEDLTKQPEYTEGGMVGIYNHINSNFKIPEIKKDMAAKIYVSFVIEKDGSMTNIKVLRDPGYKLGEEAVRVFKTVPEKWTPGEINNKPVRCSYILPITINIRN